MEILTENKTTIVIAHRLSTILNAHKIFVVDKGNIVADGTHKELIENSTIYKNFYQKQLSKNTTNPDARYESSYAMPNDALVIHTITVSDDVIKYDIYGGNIFTNTTSSDTLISDYTFQPSESDFPPFFTQTLVFELASLFAGAIARNDQLSELYHKRAVAQLAVSRALDSQQQTTRNLDLDRFRNVRNRTALNNITAKSP